MRDKAKKARGNLNQKNLPLIKLHFLFKRPSFNYNESEKVRGDNNYLESI